MKIPAPSVKCYIAALENPQIDPFLDQNGFCHGLISFAVPSYGILFRCRAGGATLDLEFAAFFSLLEFVNANLHEEQVKDLQVFSSNPQFVFAFGGGTLGLQDDSERGRLLVGYRRRCRITVSYVEPINNKIYLSPQDCPCLGDSDFLKLIKSDKEFGRQTFKPFQRGIKL